MDQNKGDGRQKVRKCQKGGKIGTKIDRVGKIGTKIGKGGGRWTHFG